MSANQTTPPPAVDPDHVHAKMYAMAAELWSDPSFAHVAIGVMQKLLDDSPLMLQVHHWIADHSDVAWEPGMIEQWQSSQYHRLLRAHFPRATLEVREAIAHRCVHQDDIDLLRVIIDVLDQGACLLALKSALLTKSPRTAIFLAKWCSAMPMAATHVLQWGHLQDSVDVWEALCDQYCILLTDQMAKEVHIRLLPACYRSNMIDIRIIIERLSVLRDENDQDALHDPELISQFAAILGEYPMDVRAALSGYLRQKECLSYATFLIRVLPDVAYGRNHLFWEIVEQYARQPLNQSLEELLLWFAEQYCVDLSRDPVRMLGHGSYNISQILSQITREQPIHYQMRDGCEYLWCDHRLVLPRCSECKIDTGYAYTRCDATRAWRDELISTFQTDDVEDSDDSESSQPEPMPKRARKKTSPAIKKPVADDSSDEDSSDEQSLDDGVFLVPRNDGISSDDESTDDVSTETSDDSSSIDI